MNSFEWNVLLFLGMLVTLAIFNHIRIIKIMDAINCMHDQSHHTAHILDEIFFGECEDCEDEELHDNMEEVQQWDNA